MPIHPQVIKSPPPRDIPPLWRYWYRLTMVARAGGYFGYPFNGQRVMDQGDPLYPTIFNVVVDAVLRNWILMVTETEGTVEPGTEVYR